MRGFLNLVGGESFKLRRRWLPWILLGVMVALLALGSFGSYLGYRSMSALPPEEGFGRGPEAPAQRAQALRQMEESLVLPTALASPLFLGQSVGMLLLVILAASVVGGEYTSGTLRQMLARGIARHQLLGAKLALVLACALALLAVVFLLGVVFYSVTTYLIRGSIGSDFLSLSLVGELLAALGRTWYVLFAPILLASVLVVLARSTAVGMAVGLAYGFLEAIVGAILHQIGGWVSHIPDYLIGDNVNAVMASNRMGAEAVRVGLNLGAAPQDANPWKAAAILAVYCAVFLAVAFLVFRRRDVTPS